MLFAMDSAWWKRHYEELGEFKGEKLTVGATAPLAKKIDLISSENSGAGAVCLAYEYGAEKIVLLGYDCKYGKDGKRHWHGDHPKELGNCESMPKFVKQFQNLAPIVARTQVINASRDTNLNVWPRMTLEEALML